MILRTFLRNYSTTNHSISQILRDKPLGPCSVHGWVRNSRKQKDFSFLDVIDGSSGNHLQVVVLSCKLPPETKHHSAISVSGELKKSGHPGQEVELVAKNVELINKCEEPYPIQAKKHFSQNFVRQHPAYKNKTNGTASLLRIRNHLSQSINQYFQERGFLHIHTPVLTSNDCEGGGQVFKISTSAVNQSSNPSGLRSSTGDRLHAEEYFDKPVYLTVSGQLHLEAVCNGIAKVYTFNPAFRAEKGRTRRHLSEFWMVEAEVAFLQDIHELLDVMEDLVKHVTKSLLDSQLEDLKAYSRSARIPDRVDFLESMLENKFHRITFSEACDLIKNNEELNPVIDDFNREHELFLCDKLGGPVFVYNWPKYTKPFYMRQCTQDSEFVSSVDLLVPGVGELCGGGLREFNYSVLEDRIGGSADLEWYLDMRKKGSAPTGGFGLGFERLIQWLVGVENIKDTIPFYRSSHECQL